MRRTPPWVFVAAVGVQLAALGLCLWAMERTQRIEIAEDEAPAQPEAPRRAQPEALAPAPPPAAADLAFLRDHVTPASHREPEAVPVYEPAAVPMREPEAASGPPVTEEPVYVRAVQPPMTAGPMFGPPPDRPPEPPPDPDAIPSYITECADDTATVARGRAAEGQFAFGFYPDGNIRFVDVDGGRYAGKAESARARMREEGGMRAFTVQIGVAADGRLQATFTGGPHDALTIPLEPLAGWSAA